MFRLASLLTVVTLLLVGYNAFHIWIYSYDAVQPCKADTLVVMGAAQYNGVPSPAFARRLDRAFELYESGCGGRILVTGGKQAGDRYTEGASGVRYLAERGVPSENLVDEVKSSTSFENLSFSQKLIEGDLLVIVTDDLHAYRTQWLARYLGLDASVVPVVTHGERLRYAARELAAVTAYNLGLVR